MKSIQQVRIFASFPSDVALEANSLDSVVEELNKTSAKNHNIRFETIRWHRDVRSGTGTDPQEFINTQIAGDFDVLVATFWGRAGTKTPRAESGAIEEVKSAIRDFKTNGKVPIVLVYAKSVGLDPIRIDREQLDVLQKFYDWLSAQGQVYKEFSDIASYEKSLRLDLSCVALELATVSPAAPVLPVHQKVRDTSMLDTDGLDNLGMLDYIDMEREASKKRVELIAHHDKAFRVFTDGFRVSSTKGASPRSTASMRKNLATIGKIWDVYSAEDSATLMELRLVTERYFYALSKIVGIGSVLSKESNKIFLEKLSLDVVHYNTHSDGLRRFKDTMERAPNLTAENNQSKKRLVSVLLDWVEYYRWCESSAKNICELLRS